MKKFEYKTVTVPDYKAGEFLCAVASESFQKRATAEDPAFGIIAKLGQDGWEMFGIRVVPRAGPLASKGEREANHEFWFKREV